MRVMFITLDIQVASPQPHVVHIAHSWSISIRRIVNRRLPQSVACHHDTVDSGDALGQ